MGERRHREIHDVEQMKKMVPLITHEITFGQRVSNLVLGVNIFDLDVGVQIDSAKQPVQRCSVHRNVERNEENKHVTAARQKHWRTASGPQKLHQIMPQERQAKFGSQWNVVFRLQLEDRPLPCCAAYSGYKWNVSIFRPSRSRAARFPLHSAAAHVCAEDCALQSTQLQCLRCWSIETCCGETCA